MNFKLAKKILGPYIDAYKGKITISDFEEAYRSFIKLGIKDIAHEYQKEQKEIAKEQREKHSINNLSDAKARLREIQNRIKNDGDGADVLSKALTSRGFDVDTVENLADVVELLDETVVDVKDQIKERPFSSNFAKIFFFLRAVAPDATVFEEIAQPFFENILLRSSDDQDLKIPKKPIINKSAKPGQRKNQQAKLKAYPAKLKKFEERLKNSINENYKFILEKLGEAGSKTILTRLSELS